MKKFIKFSTAIICSGVLSLTTLHAQLLPPNQPEQDACSALQICGNFYTPFGYQGQGSTLDLATTPCTVPLATTGEAHAIWLRLEVNTPGSIVFSINPIDAQDDYDFAVLNITGGNCNNLLQPQVIRCNFNNNEQPNTFYPGGIIGLNSTSTITSAAGGVYGQAFLQQINASAGDVYLIMVNNYGHDNCFGNCPGSGFLLDFAGSTATFNQPPPPALKQVIPYCNLTQQITVQLTQPVRCNSIAADGSDFYLTGGGTIASAQGVNCAGATGYTDKVKLIFTGTLANGDRILHAQTGTDGNTLIGLCNAELITPDSLKFHVGLDPIEMVSVDSPACQKIRINLSLPFKCSSLAADGSDFLVTGPGSVIIGSAAPVSCNAAGMASSLDLTLTQPIQADGLYTITSKIGNDGNCLFDTCGRILPPTRRIQFRINSFNGILTALPDTIICNVGQTANLYGQNNGTAPGGGFSYQWAPPAGIANPNALVTTATITNFLSHYILTTQDVNGCFLRDSITIKVQPFYGTINPVTADICVGDKITLHAGDGSTYAWYSDANLTSVPATIDCATCQDPTVSPAENENNYYLLITNANGCSDTLKSTVYVHEKPIVSVYPADTTIRYGDAIMLYADGAEMYYWSPTATLSDAQISNPIATPREPVTRYMVTGSNEYGCLATDTSIVRIDYRQKTDIPNAFSPNGDGLNDVFKVSNIGLRKLLVFQVFDRWGKLVFETTERDLGWDGTQGGSAVNAGVYHYFIKLGYGDKLIETFKGDVTLIK